MDKRKSIVAAALAGFVGVGLMAAQVGAQYTSHTKINGCQFATTGFDQVGHNNVLCNQYSGGHWARGSSLSGYHAPGIKGVIAELKSRSFGNNQSWPEVGGQGFNGTTPITNCWTGYDDTANGATVGDGNGCDSMTKHVLEFYLGKREIG